MADIFRRFFLMAGGVSSPALLGGCFSPEYVVYVEPEYGDTYRDGGVTYHYRYHPHWGFVWVAPVFVGGRVVWMTPHRHYHIHHGERWVYYEPRRGRHRWMHPDGYIYSHPPRGYRGSHQKHFHGS